MLKRVLITISLVIFAVSANAKSILINEDWRFKLENKEWQDVQIPHDWAFANGYSEYGAQRDRGGYAMGGVGYYTKDINISESDLKSGKIFIDFDGVYMNSEVWCNDHYLGKRPYGYIPFSYELTDLLVAGVNTIRVRVDNSLEPSARWYHGCGIYGNVSVRYADDIYFEKDGTYITTNEKNISVSTEIISKTSTKKRLVLAIYDNNGVMVASESRRITLNKGLNVVDMQSSLQSVLSWSPESPYLYTLKLSFDDVEQITKFGFRTLEWFAETGFHLNGKQYKLRGVCEHMEGGPTGAITSPEIMRWRLQQIKDMGCNAVRTAHNPYLPIFYDICDEMGLLVLDEIFDGWKKKAEHDYGAHAFDEWWQRDLTAFIRRDRNHPSVFLWSVGNETHGDVAPELVALCKKLDPTREVTSGDSNAMDMTVYGMNGRSEREGFAEWWESEGINRPFIATENPHTWQVRGYYRALTWYRNGYPNDKLFPHYIPNFIPKEIFTYDWVEPTKRRNAKQIFNSSYDNATVRVTARHLIAQLRDKDWMAGSFRWTGYDYLGEAGYVHGGWPFRASLSGALDLAGFKKDLFYLYQSEWGDKDMVHILPHWTHPNMKEGEQIPVVVYTSGDEVELFQDGKSLGRQKKGATWEEMQLVWLVPWREGKIDAIAYRNGEQIAKAEMQSAGAPTQITVEKYESRELRADKTDVAILSVAAKDTNGVLYPYGENRLYTKIYGDAKVLSFESGNPVDVEINYDARDKRFFFGLNRLFIQSTGVGDASIVMGSILGDKKLTLSNKISIVVDEISLRGALSSRTYRIYYSLNGGDKILYANPFSVELGTTVTAYVYDGEKEVLQMQEEFSQSAGLYWGRVGEPTCLFTGEQAELALLTDARESKRSDTGELGDGYYGESFVVIPKAGGSITWYQENDGAPFDAEMTIRYSQQLKGCASSTMLLSNDDVEIATIEFPNTGSSANNWKEITITLPMKSGGNNIKLKSLSDNSPSLDQAEFK